MKKINVFLNGEYLFSTTKYKKCKDVIKEIRNAKHLVISSIPDKYVTIYDYDKVTAKFAK